MVEGKQQNWICLMLNVERYINTECWNNRLKKAVCDIQKDIHLNASPSHTGLRRLCRLSPSHLASADTRKLWSSLTPQQLSALPQQSDFHLPPDTINQTTHKTLSLTYQKLVNYFIMLHLDLKSPLLFILPVNDAIICPCIETSRLFPYLSHTITVSYTSKIALTFVLSFLLPLFLS